MLRCGLVSVIIPVYNRAQLVGRAIDSVLAQDFQDLEVICVDDHSSDESPEIIQSYVSRYPEKVRYLVNVRGKGVSGARNSGIQAARGEFVAFLDSDDVFKPFHIRESVIELQRNPDIDWIFADFERWRAGKLIEQSAFSSNAGHMKAFHPVGEGLLKRRTASDLAVVHIRHETIPGLHTSVIRRSVCDGLSFDERIHILEDWKYRFQAIKKGVKFGYLEKVHHEYHIHDSNTSSTMQHDTQKALRQCSEFEKIAACLDREYLLSASEKAALKKRVAEFLFWAGYSEFLHGQLDAADYLMSRSISQYALSPRLIKTYALFKARIFLAKSRYTAFRRELENPRDR